MMKTYNYVTMRQIRTAMLYTIRLKIIESSLDIYSPETVVTIRLQERGLSTAATFFEKCVN